MSLRTEFGFTLPKGYVDQDGTLHTRGTMRLATTRDELEPLRDPRVAQNEAYLTVLVLSRVITELGTVRQITPAVIEGLFAADLAYLQDVYGIINFGDAADLAALEEAEQEEAVGPDPEPSAPADEAEAGEEPLAEVASLPSGRTRTRVRASR